VLEKDKHYTVSMPSRAFKKNLLVKQTQKNLNCIKTKNVFLLTKILKNAIIIRLLATVSLYKSFYDKH